jgi:hypothetical protein
MKTFFTTLVFLLFTVHFSYGQMSIKGQVINAKNEKLLASIYHFGSNLSGDFIGEFEIKIDSLGGAYYVYALGYDTQEVIIRDSLFLTVMLKETKQHPRQMLRRMKRQDRARKKMKRQMRNGRIPISGGCCFVSGTKVLMTNEHQENIENLQLGDSILTYDFNSETFISAEIQRIDIVLHDNIIEINLERGIKIKNTADHPYYVFGKGICSFDPQKTYREYGIEAQQLQVNDSCFFYSAGHLVLIQIVGIETLVGSFMTYNISEIKNNNTYFVNGVLVNNEKEKLALETQNGRE